VPEGDTIFRAARTLHRALAGSAVAHFESVLPMLSRVDEDAPLKGRTVARVYAAGKHLLIEFSGGLTLRTHMRMNGSWHIYRRGERWQRPRRDMRIVVANETYEAVAFRVPVAEFVETADLPRHDELRQLGPDLLGDTFDAADALARLRARAADTIADALLDQRVVAGIGNVYKSEILFTCKVNPFLPVQALDDATLGGLLATARRFLTTNVKEGLPLMTTYAGYRRTTGRSDPTQRLWVYGRAGKPCRRCATAIDLRAHGVHARLTYWCPTCQAVGEPGR
jgi:endonuclease VIII